MPSPGRLYRALAAYIDKIVRITLMLYIESRKWEEDANFHSWCDGHTWLRAFFFLTDSLRTEAASLAAQTHNLFLQERYRLCYQRAMERGPWRLPGL